MSSVPNTAITTVATREGSIGMPAAFRIAGFTTMMYDMVTKVVSPATTSRPKVVPVSSNRKYFATKLLAWFLELCSSIHLLLTRNPDYASQRGDADLKKGAIHDMPCKSLLLNRRDYHPTGLRLDHSA